MDMENPLPTQTAEPGPENGDSARTDGLAAALAAQESAGSEASGGGEAAGEAKRRGRPPIHGRYSQAAGSDGHTPAPTGIPIEFPEAPGNAPEIPAAPRVAIPSDLLTKVIREGINCGERFAVNKLEGVAQKAGLNREEIKPQLDQAALGEDRKHLVAELTPLAMQEWGLDPQMSPTAALSLLLVPWAFGATTAYLELARLAAEKAARDRQKPVQEKK